MAPFATWLPDVLRDAGVDVYVMPGAETRGSRGRGFDLDAIIWHHTATGLNWQDGHVAFLLRDGRADLSGPLAQVGIERDGTWVIVALGRANHNGYGLHGNSALGLEFYNSGVGESWPMAQVESGVRGTAAVRNHVGMVPVLGHKESDPGRKVDPFGLNMNTIRQRIIEPSADISIVEDNEMFVELIRMGYRRSRGADYEPSTDPKDPGGWTGWMIRLAFADTPAARRDVVALQGRAIDREIESRK